MILLNKRNFTNILYEVYNLIKSPLGIIYHKYNDIDIFFPMLRYYLGQRTHNFNDNINKHFYIVWIHCVFY